jgi:hypothetical protein
MIVKAPMDHEDKWAQIKSECPKLYQQGMYFECGPGWADLIYKLSVKIEKILENSSDNKLMYATQVKEKYGSLRFYMSSATDEIYDLITDSEDLSGQICENCGEIGEMRGPKWFNVLCDACFNK